MNMPFHRITELILKYHRNSLSPEEQEELQQWQAVSEKRRRLFRELTEEQWLKEELKHQDSYSEQRVWEKFEALVPEVHAKTPESETPSEKKPAIYPIVFRRAVAAAILLLVGVGTLLYVKQGNTSKIPGILTIQPAQDLAPGGNKAILTLSGGRQIILDSAHRGILTQQGNVSIIKTDSGKLTYNLLNEKPTEVSYNTLTTPRGGQYQLTLPDGSRVWLNAASSITYPTAFTGPERKVTISGEVYLEVAKASSQLFRVTVNRMDLEVLGTSFNINAYPDETGIRTTLLEGAVRLTAGENSINLKPGQQSDLQDHFKISNVNTEYAVAWKNGLFRFDDERLEIIMKVVSRWYNVEVVFEDDSMKEQTYSVVSTRFANISALLSNMEKTGNAQFNVEGSVIRVGKKN